MPLILAIEPDRRQASQLTALVRGRLQAELVLGDSADRALAALGERVPDLILTAALLSPKDEAALDQRLRELNGVAAHVQTLTIPVLASAKRSSRSLRGGLLSALRRDKPQSAAPDGCDPAIFAEQCKEYLERAASERQPLDDDTHRDGLLDRIDPSETLTQPHAAHDVLNNGAHADRETVTGDLADFVEEARIATPQSKATLEAPIFEESILQQAFAPEPIAAPPIIQPPAVASRSVEPPTVESRQVEQPIVKAAARAPRESRQLEDPLALGDGPASLVAALALFEAEEEVANTRVEHAPIERAPVHTDAVDGPSDVMDLSTLLDPIGSHRRAATPAEDEPAVDVYEIDSAILQPSAMFDDHPQPSGADAFEALPHETPSRWPALDAPAAATATLDAAADEDAPDTGTQDETDHPQEWLDIIEALRRDAEAMPIRKARVETEAAPLNAHVEGEMETELTPPSPPAPEPPKRTKRRRDTPAQDEWGFFDPDQCGFAALLEKLQEVSE